MWVGGTGASKGHVVAVTGSCLMIGCCGKVFALEVDAGELVPLAHKHTLTGAYHDQVQPAL